MNGNAYFFAGLSRAPNPPSIMPAIRLSWRTTDPGERQERLLRALLTRAARTEWGRRFDFARIARADDVVAAYQARVPLHAYDDIGADVRRMRAGEGDILWPGSVRHFAVSGGTTSTGRIIPVSQGMLRRIWRFGVSAGLGYLARARNYRYLGGKHLFMPGRIEEDPAFPGTLIGEVSGLQYEYTPTFFKVLLRAVPDRLLFLSHWEEKLRSIVDHTVDMDIRSVTMAPTWAYPLFQMLIARHHEKYNSGAACVGDVWPNLQLFIAGGVALSSYRAIIERMIGLPGMDFLETYGASEGFFAHQDDLSDPAMRLRLDSGVFYEFVPMSELGASAPTRETVATAEPGVRYAMVVTTSSGLWAYQIGDVVRFTQTAPPRLVVAGRTAEVIDRYGEAVFGEEAAAAIQHASRATGAQVLHFHVAPGMATVERLPSLQWLIEFTTPPQSVEEFATVLDRHLCAGNRHYQIRREAHAFCGPDLVHLPRGAFYAWLNAGARRVGVQTKVPRMSGDRSIAEALLSIAGAVGN